MTEAANFTGVEYRRLANELAAYGIAVVTAWLLSGEMFRYARRVIARWDRDLRAGLSTMSLDWLARLPAVIERGPLVG